MEQILWSGILAFSILIAAFAVVIILVWYYVLMIEDFGLQNVVKLHLAFLSIFLLIFMVVHSFRADHKKCDKIVQRQNYCKV